MKDFNYEIKEGSFEFGVDSDNDGEMSVKGKLNLNEAIQEAMRKGTAVDGVKVAEVKFELTKLIIMLDTDKDGEKLMEITIDLAESFSEVSERVL